MIRVHHLNNSRSQRVLWLLEELGVPYEVIPYQRDPKTRLAPPELKAIHRLGKSPVIEDGGRVIAESGAIIEYLVGRYGSGQLAPDPASTAYVDHIYWMHFAEGSAMLPLMLNLYTGRLGDAAAPIAPRITSEIANHLGLMEEALDGKAYILGNELDAADIMLEMVVEFADWRGLIKDYPNLKAYLARCHARPAFKRAEARGGPVRPDV